MSQKHHTSGLKPECFLPDTQRCTFMLLSSLGRSTMRVWSIGGCRHQLPSHAIVSTAKTLTSYPVKISPPFPFQLFSLVINPRLILPGDGRALPCIRSFNSVFIKIPNLLHTCFYNRATAKSLHSMRGRSLLYKKIKRGRNKFEKRGM